MVRLHDLNLDAFTKDFERKLQGDMAKALKVAAQDVQLEALAGSMVLVVKASWEEWCMRPAVCLDLT